VKYLNEGGFHRNPLMRLTLGLTLVLLVVFWTSAWAMHFQRMGLTPHSVVDYYNGNEEQFRAPQSLGSMTETLHIHMAMMSLLLLLLTHLAIFIPMAPRLKVPLIATTFASALMEEGAGWLVRFVSPAFAPLKVVGLLGLQLTTAVLMGLLAAFLFRSERRLALRQAARPERAPRVHLSLDASVDGATLLDISATGMRLELAVPLELHAVHTFHLLAHGRGENVAARVMSCQPREGQRNVFQIGLEFTQLSAAMRELLSRETASPAVGEE